MIMSSWSRLALAKFKCIGDLAIYATISKFKALRISENLTVDVGTEIGSSVQRDN